MFENLTNKDIAILILFFVILIILWINRIWRRIHNKEPGLKEIIEAAQGRDFNAEMQESENAENSDGQKIFGESENPNKTENSSEQNLSAYSDRKSELNYEKEFFSRTENGEKAVLLQTVSSLQKCKILQSLLYSAGIPSFAQTEKLSGIFGNTSGLPDTMFSVKLNVLESDKETARQILESKEIETETNAESEK